jgi:hypothetical protein
VSLIYDASATSQALRSTPKPDNGASTPPNRRWNESCYVRSRTAFQ